MSRLRLVVFAVALLAAYFQSRLEDMGFRPLAAPLPPLPESPPLSLIRNLTGQIEILGRDELVGPESLVASGDFMFVTLGNGQIARLTHSNNEHGVTWTFLSLSSSSSSSTTTTTTYNGTCAFSPSDQAETEQHCGRPLGIKVVKRSTVDPHFTTASTSTAGEAAADESDTDEDVLLVADAYKGLLMVTHIYAHDVSQVTVTTLATRAKQDPPEYQFRLLNALIQAPDGSIYVTETSQLFPRRRIFYAALDGRKTGRLLRYTKQEGMQVVLDRLSMPNGLALTHHHDDEAKNLLIVCGLVIQRYSLRHKRLIFPHFVHVLPGTGDNIDAKNHLPSGEPRKCYWAGLGSKYTQPFSLLHYVSDKPLLKSILVALVPYKMIVYLIPKWSALAVYDETGTLLEIYKDDSVVFPWVSEGESFGGYLYLGSWYNPFLARIKMGDKVTTTS